MAMIHRGGALRALGRSDPQAASARAGQAAPSAMTLCERSGDSGSAFAVMREATTRNRFGRDARPQGSSHGLFRHRRRQSCKAHQAGASEQAERGVTGTGGQAASVGE